MRTFASILIHMVSRIFHQACRANFQCAGCPVCLCEHCLSARVELISSRSHYLNRLPGGVSTLSLGALLGSVGCFHVDRKALLLWLEELKARSQPARRYLLASKHRHCHHPWRRSISLAVPWATILVLHLLRSHILANLEGSYRSPSANLS